jgi:hypothetical protein
MAQYNGISKRTKNALVAIMSAITYDAGSGSQQAFQNVIGTTEGEFDGYPILRVLPGELRTEKAATAENERTLVFILRTVLALEETTEESSTAYDIKNTDVTIGAAANPGLVFTMPKVRLNTFDMSDDLDTVVEQTVGFTAELDVSAGYAVRAHTQASY